MDKTLLLRNGRVFDAVAGTVQEGYDVLIRGKKIEEMGPSLPEEGHEVVELGGRFLMPGMWDVHAHPGLLIGTPEEQLTMMFEKECERTLRSLENAQRALDVGFTGLRVTGEANFIDVALRDAFAAGTFEGPRIYACGRPIKMTGGHGAHRGQEARYCHFHIEADGRDAFSQAARFNLKHGADGIKLMVTGGIAGGREGVTESQLDYEEMRAAVEAAERKGGRVCAHVGGSASVKLCIKAGVHSIEHGYEFDDEAVEMMLEKGTFLVPTLIVSQDEEWMRRYDWDQLSMDKALAAAETHRESFLRAYRGGVKIANGADWSPIYDTAQREVENVVWAGMQPADALMSSTRLAAELAQANDYVGTIEEGKLADLVVLDGDPLTNISEIRKVDLVLKEGCVVRDYTAQRG